MASLITNPHRARRRHAVLVVASAVVVAACGSSSAAPDIPFDPVPPATTAPPTTTTEPAPTTVAETSATPASTDATTATTDAADGSPGLVTEDEWRNVTANLANMEADCGNLTTVASRPGSDELIAGVALRGLWSLGAPGDDWVPLGEGEGSDDIMNRTANILFDPELPTVYWSAGSYSTDESNGVHVTLNSGETYIALGDMGHVDAVGVDLSDPERRTLLASRHEQQDLFLSVDGGQTWTSLADNLPEGFGSSNVPWVVDESTFLVGSWLTEEPAIFRSTDRGATWQRAYDGYVLELAMPFVLPDGSILWPLHNELGVVRSTDGGATWEPWSFAPLVVPIVDMGDGRLASATAYQVMVSEDDGVNWVGVGPALPFRPWGFSYVQGHETFYISQWDCELRVLPDAVASLSIVSG